VRAELEAGIQGLVAIMSTSTRALSFLTGPADANSRSMLAELIPSSFCLELSAKRALRFSSAPITPPPAPASGAPGREPDRLVESRWSDAAIATFVRARDRLDLREVGFDQWQSLGGEPLHVRVLRGFEASSNAAASRS
jgi:hypothetical protein